MQYFIPGNWIVFDTQALNTDRYNKVSIFLLIFLLLLLSLLHLHAVKLKIKTSNNIEGRRGAAVIQEKQLLARVLKGEKAAFQPLVIKYSKLVYTTALKIVRDPAAAEDISQEAFWQAFRSLSSFRFQASFSTWLVRITVNKSLDYCRQEKRHRLLRDGQELYTRNSIPEDLDPQEAVIKLEEQSELYRKIENLPDIYRRAILEHYIKRKTYREMAGKEKVSVKTIESRIYRAKAMLKKVEPGGEKNEMPRTSTS
jgi:RNA polymerase sigma factor (sigma-70 family)